MLCQQDCVTELPTDRT